MDRAGAADYCATSFSAFSWMALITQALRLVKSTKRGSLYRITPHHLKGFVHRRKTSSDGRARTAWVEKLDWPS
jgi:hypothetical protein